MKKLYYNNLIANWRKIYVVHGSFYEASQKTVENCDYSVRGLEIVIHVYKEILTIFIQHVGYEPIVNLNGKWTNIFVHSSSL